MATVTSVVTTDTGEWIYLDRNSAPHTVTNAQTFNLTIDDNSATDVRYRIENDGQSVTTTDGYVIKLRPNVDGGNVARSVEPLTDAGEGSDFLNRRGELIMECTATGDIQIWSVAKINPSNADYNAAGTITMTLEDQFGNVMVMPATGSGITVAQAA